MSKEIESGGCVYPQITCHEFRNCPKCNSDNIGTQWVCGRNCGELMKRTCGCCGYVWFEKPLDAKEEVRHEG